MTSAGPGTPAPFVLARREHPVLDGLAQRQGLVLLQRVRVIQAAGKRQVGDLFEYLRRVRDAAKPEGIPDGVDLGAEFAGEHVQGLWEFDSFPQHGTKPIVADRHAELHCPQSQTCVSIAVLTHTILH